MKCGRTDTELLALMEGYGRFREKYSREEEAAERMHASFTDKKINQNENANRERFFQMTRN